MFSDQRGVKQEIYLVTKRGLEAKSYEGVSSNFVVRSIG